MVTTSEFTVTLERVFQGPMDLLLHLVREQEVEIHEIELSKVISAYLAYLEALRELDIELAGDFLVMASTLMSIKSRSLLPREEIDLAEELDPRDELIQRLLEYRRFKETSDTLAAREAERARLHGRGGFDELAAGAEEPTLDLGSISRWDLLGAFSRLMRETLADRPHHVAGVQGRVAARRQAETTHRWQIVHESAFTLHAAPPHAAGSSGRSTLASFPARTRR